MCLSMYRADITLIIVITLSSQSLYVFSSSVMKAISYVFIMLFITYSELEGAVSVDSDSKDPLLTDVNNKFIGCMEQFQKSTKVRT